MEKSYHCGARSSCVEKLNSSPYEPNGCQEECLEEKTVETKAKFVENTLKEFAHEGKATAGTNLSNYRISDKWWSHDVTAQLLGDSNPATVNLDCVYQTAIAHSTQVKVFGNIPIIREAGIDEARGAFDTEAFSTMKLNRIHEPVGSRLEAGGNQPYFSEREWTMETGVRKQLRTGAQASLTQGNARTTNNSQFFTPSDQGKGRLSLTLMQPLLRGAGIRYNESVIRIAKLDHQIGTQEFIRQIETHLTKVNRSFWALYLARAIYVEKKRIVGETEATVQKIRGRGNLDTMASQRARAESALASRQAELVRSELAIKNAESRLRALINDPGLIERGIGELIPCDSPITSPVCTSFEDAAKVAIACRPEIRQAEHNLQASNIREQMARQDKLPELNLFGETSISDLHGSGDWEGAMRSEFNDSEPNWAVGVTVSQSIERRLPRAQHLRSEIELRQQHQRLQSTMETVQLEVRVAYREVTTAFPDMVAKHKAALAAEKDLEVMKRRRSVDGDGGANLASVYLENLIEAQGRLLTAREEFLKSLIVYNVALTNFERAKGTLIRSEGFDFEKGVDDCGLPELRLAKAGSKGLIATPVHFD
ncbi:MAG: TolC family protein [Verrucomicrobiales bacterium]|nr:TolC family protein [Verrucomicrobiales bacterium]